MNAHFLAYEYLKKEQKSDFFNIGTEKGYSVKEVFECAKKVTNKDIKFEYCDRRAGDVEILLANASKAYNVLGWKAEKTLEESIKTAYLWYNKSS